VTEYTAATWEDVAKARTRKKVACVGFASSTRDQAPWMDESFEIWTLNDLGRQVPRWDRLFEMHTKEHLLGTAVARAADGTGVADNSGGAVPYGPEHWEYMGNCPPPGDPKFGAIYMQQHYEDIPASVALPVQEMAAKCFQADEGLYFTSTPAYMLGLAILEGFEEVHLYGIDLLQEGEYAYEKPCVEYLVGLARGMGITVYIPRQSALCKAGFVYGFSDLPQSDSLDKLSTYVQSTVPKFEESIVGRREEFGATKGYVQALDAVSKWLSERAEAGPNTALSELEQLWIAFYQEQRAAISKKQLTVSQQLGVAQGTLQTAMSLVTWCGHLKRGGELLP
jgi:hypothetical protein